MDTDKETVKSEIEMEDKLETQQQKLIKKETQQFEYVEFDREVRVGADILKQSQIMNKNEQKYLKDFDKNGDDMPALSKTQFNLLDRYEKFEKKFPFYRMDVNGFMKLLRNAMTQMKLQEPLKPLHTVKCVTLEALQEAFQNHQTWLNQLVILNPDCPPDLIKLLDLTCQYQDNKENSQEHVYSVRALRCLGFLWCNGNSQEKAFEFYNIIQDNNQDRITANDKDFEPNVFMLFYFSSKMVIDYEELDLSKKNSMPISQEYYEQHLTKFIDEIFECDGTLSRETFLNEVVKKQDWILCPKKIRERLEYQWQSTCDLNQDTILIK